MCSRAVTAWILFTVSALLFIGFVAGNTAQQRVTSRIYNSAGNACLAVIVNGRGEAELQTVPISACNGENSIVVVEKTLRDSNVIFQTKQHGDLYLTDDRARATLAVLPCTGQANQLWSYQDHRLISSHAVQSNDIHKRVVASNKLGTVVVGYVPTCNQQAWQVLELDQL